MLIRKPTNLRYSDVTPELVYLNRRRFLTAGAGALGAAALVSAGCSANSKTIETAAVGNPGDDKPTSLDIITHYNNFYEFGTGKEDPSENAPKWKPNPAWTVRIEGEVAKAKTIGLDEIMKLAPVAEHIYRHRCVEMWSIVVPWLGFPLAELLKQVEPTGNAKYVAFESFYDPSVMISSREAGIAFPYVEGLRIDEAMHPLALLSTGLYGKPLPNQNGAPLRLVVPWKYGFKSIKSISRIRLVEQQPPTTWNIAWAEAYGFYSNVNPNRPHPQNGPQNQERRLGEGPLGAGVVRQTQMFNGYTEVAGLYSGMDLIKNY
jgi:methionine sulfoxide reductase catalytic subunit